MDNILSQENFDNALKRKGWTQTKLIKEYDNKYNTDTGKSIEGTIKNWRTPNGNPTIYLLTRVCNLLDCDIDYLLGKQDTPRKEYAHIAEMTGLSYNAAGHLEEWAKKDNDNNGYIPIISAIIEDTDLLNSILIALSEQKHYDLVIREDGKNEIMGFERRYGWDKSMAAEKLSNMIDQLKEKGEKEA